MASIDPRSAEVGTLLADIAAIKRHQVFEYMSQWSFERMLDDVATRVASFLSERYRTDVGCSLFYQTSVHRDRYVIGGSSAQRTRIDPDARLYILDPDASTRSFTARAIQRGQIIALDDFQSAKKKLKKVISHKSKDCELRVTDQKSVLAIPGPLPERICSQRAKAARSSANGDLVELPALADDELPAGLVRLAFAQTGLATEALIWFEKSARDVLKACFALLKQGRESLQHQEDAPALAIADLNRNLLQYGRNEYRALEGLVSHLQTVFGDCECSVFRAVPVEDHVHLYLAATTALSTSSQHCTFRRHFFNDHEHYVCFKDPRKRGPERKWSKTVAAYYHKGKPVYIPESKGKGGFPGCGECAAAMSYLALAIPPSEPHGEPYGVIRLVRCVHPDSPERARIPFTTEQKRLAGAIAKTLAFWLEMFPRGDDLQVEWVGGANLERDTLQMLFQVDRPSRTEPVERQIEFVALMRKIFAGSRKVLIQGSFPGFSGAAILLVQADDGPELIVKCASKIARDPSVPITHENAITEEVSNYLAHVQGKIRPNHNMIYPETQRETRRVSGFASSFVGSGVRGRRQLTDAVAKEESTERAFRLITDSVRFVIKDICSSWYKQAEPREAANAAQFLSEALRDGDMPWHVKYNALPSLEDHIHDVTAKGIFPIPESDLPSQVWTRFSEWAPKSGPVLWEKCVTHGDLHGGNIFVDPRVPEAWLIDFARTGERTSVFDLAALEAVIKFDIFPSMLKARATDLDKRALITSFAAAENTLLSQREYNRITLPTISKAETPQASEILEETVGAVHSIRTLLHDALGRRGNMTDYYLVLLLQSFRYINTRVTSAPASPTLGIILAAVSCKRQVDWLMAPVRKGERRRWGGMDGKPAVNRGHPLRRASDSV